LEKKDETKLDYIYLIPAIEDDNKRLKEIEMKSKELGIAKWINGTGNIVDSQSKARYDFNKNQI
jgi:hypothetical protein